MFVSLDKDKRIIATAAKAEYLINAMEFDFPVGFQFSLQNEFLIVDGKLVHDPLPAPEPQPTIQDQVNDLTLVVAEMIGAM